MKFLKHISIIFITICFVYLWQYSYSKYKEKIEGTSDIRIASWNIKINSESINNKKKLENNITPIFPGNEYINEGVIAPNAEGYYDIIIDCSEVDVSFKFSLTVENSNESSISDIAVIGYQINPDIDDTMNTYVDKIEQNISKNTDNINIRIYIKWIDDESSTMSNEQDTDAAIENSKITILNNIKFEQNKES